MIQRCHVCAEPFWLAVSHCEAPVYLPGGACADLRFLSDTQKKAILSSNQNASIDLELQFRDMQDYVRFVLAYLLTERELS